MVKSGWTSRISDLWRGALAPAEGLGLLLRSPRLLSLAALPVALTAAVSLAAAAWMYRSGDVLLARLWARPAFCESCGLWGRALSWLAGGTWTLAWWMLGLAVVGLAGLLVSRVATAPLMDFLAQGAMRKLGAGPPAGQRAFGDLPLHRSVPSSLGRALLRGLVFLAGAAAIALLALVPGAAVVATPLGFAWTAAWLYADTTLYALQWVGPARLADVSALARARPALALGFALSTAALMLVPLAGLVLTPVAVAGACLIVSRAAAVGNSSGEGGGEARRLCA